MKQQIYPRVEVDPSSASLVDDNGHDYGAYVMSELYFLLERAAEMGVVVTVETVPREPLAMRNYQMVGRVRAAR